MARPAARSHSILRLAALAGMLATTAAMADGGAPAAMRVWAIGLPSGYIVMEHQAIVLHITAADIVRGEAEVRSGTRLALTTRSPSGFAVEFRGRSPVIRAVAIEGIGHPVQLGPDGGTVVAPEAAAGVRKVDVHYRFILSPDARPGDHPWPLELTVRTVAPLARVPVPYGQPLVSIAPCPMAARGP